MILLRDLPDALGGALAIEKVSIAQAFFSQHDVFCDREDRDEHEVLVDHANPCADGITGFLNLEALPADQNLPFVRGIESIENVHEGGLAGAVFAQQGVYLAWVQIQVYMIVRQNTGEALSDAAKLEDRFHDHLGSTHRGLCVAHRRAAIVP